MAIHVTAAPSPNGTNKAGLYLGVLGRPAVAFAADSARRRRANDAAIGAALSDLQIFLNAKLNPADQRQAEQLVTALLNATPNDSDSDADSDDDQTAEDRRRRRMAGDRSGVSELSKRFPNVRPTRQSD